MTSYGALGMDESINSMFPSLPEPFGRLKDPLYSPFHATEAPCSGQKSPRENPSFFKPFLGVDLHGKKTLKKSLEKK